MFGFLAPWEGHTDASRELAQDIAHALTVCGLSQKAAALEMGIHPADLNHQLEGRDPLNLWRLTALPGEFWLAFLSRRVARLGGEVLTADQLNLVKGAAALGPRMLSTILDTGKVKAS